jgi:hypothetical protein
MTRNAVIAERVREIREELYGESGIEILARGLRLPPQTWINYERGVVMPANVVLEFLELTGADAHWLLTGEGERLTVPKLNRGVF